MDTEPRSTADLIRELEAESQNFTYLFLIVSFSSHNERISSTSGSSEDRLRRLNGLIEQGGIPLGFIGITGGKTDGNRQTFSFSKRVLSEHTGDALAHCDEILGKIIAAMISDAEEGGAKPEWN